MNIEHIYYSHMVQTLKLVMQIHVNCALNDEIEKVPLFFLIGGADVTHVTLFLLYYFFHPTVCIKIYSIISMENKHSTFRCSIPKQS